MASLTFGSIFAGIGGFDLGFERAGMICKWQVEIDDYATRVLEKHWPNVKRFRDVREFANTEQRKLEAGYVDLICGGDPCQGNSRANQVHNTKHEDLGSHFVRVVDAIRPRFVVRENPADTKADALWHWWTMRNKLEQIGYAVLPFRVTARMFGRDHGRARTILVGERTDTYSKRRSGFNWEGFEAGNICRVDSPELRTVTQPENLRSSPSRCGVCDGVSRRVDRLRGLGNAVVPQVAEWIGKQIVGSINQTKD